MNDPNLLLISIDSLMDLCTEIYYRTNPALDTGDEDISNNIIVKYEEVLNEVESLTIEAFEKLEISSDEELTLCEGNYIRELLTILGTMNIDNNEVVCVAIVPTAILVQLAS